MIFLKSFISSMSIADAIIYFFMFILIFLSFKNKKNTIIYANFIAALGMIGTFLGICIGLSDFNPNDITKSIPILLQGMRTAFFTSLIGMSISIVLKFKYSNSKEETFSDTTDDAILEQTKKITKLTSVISLMNNNISAISDLIYKDMLRKEKYEQENFKILDELKHLSLIKDALKDIDIHIRDINNSIGNNIAKQLELSSKANDILDKINKDNEEKLNSIISTINENNSQNIKNIKELSADVIETINISSNKAQQSSSELVSEFRDFSQTMAENNNKAFIQALNESMRDLNIKLTEQFGENFKELNKAVFKLVEWQEHYKNTVIETTENQKVIFEGITKAKDDLAQFVSKGEQVSQIADDLQQTIDITKEKQAEFNTELQVLSEINKSAKELIPTFARVNNTMDENLNTFKNSLDEISLNINEITNNTVNEFQKTYSEFSNNISQSIDKFNSLMSENAINFEKTSTETLGGIQKAYSELSNAMISSQNEFNEVLKENNVSFKENVNRMSTDAVSEVQRVYVEFSNNIGQSTEQLNTLMSENAINFEKTSTETLGGIQKAYSELSNAMISSKDEFDKILTENSLVFKENNEKIVSSTNEQVINAISQLYELSRKLVEESNIKTQGYLENINSLFEKAIDNVKQMNINLEKEGTEITTKTSQSIEQLNAQVNENLKTSVENIKNGLEAALNASLTSLGDELAILSNKFVKDYTPLTEQLRDIVSISKGARR